MRSLTRIWSARSNEEASLISRSVTRPTTCPSSLTIGRCRMVFVRIRPKASRIGVVLLTTMGFGVMKS